MPQTNIAIKDAALIAFCKKYGVGRLALFGSVLRNDFDDGRSDIDVLVEFLPDATRSLFTIIEMERTLSQLFGRAVDLNTPGSLSKYFRDDVVASAEVLYDAA